MNSRWKISVKYNFVLTCKLNTFQMLFLFTNQDTQRKSWSTSIWIKLTPIVDWSLDVKEDYFRPQKEYKEILGLEVPYIYAIDTLMYFANCTWTYKSNSQLMGNTDAWYLSDPDQRTIKNIILFICDNIVIAWRFIMRTKMLQFMKQTHLT